jgi:hypothetical protein
MGGVNDVFVAMLAGMGLIFLVGWVRIRWDE